MITELNVMKRLKPHPHVLKLIGCCSISGKSGPTIIKTILVCIITIVMETLFNVFLNAQLENSLRIGNLQILLEIELFKKKKKERKKTSALH